MQLRLTKHILGLSLALSGIGCANEVVDEGDVDVGIASEALTYSSVNSNGGAPLNEGSSNKKSCMRGFAMASGPSGPNTYSCSSDACTSSVASSISVGSCFDFTIGSWNKACPITQNGTMVGYQAYSQNVENCGYYKWIDSSNLAIKGSSNFSNNTTSWPATINPSPTCHMRTATCAGNPGGANIGGGLCLIRVCP
jgi:hypothetical protein